MLEFLQKRFTAWLTPSTLKVYAVAIRAYHIPLCGISLGKTPWYLIFLRGTWGSVLLLSECGPGKAQFALPNTGIRCLYPQSCPVAEKLTVVHMSWPPNKGRASGWSRPSYESAGQPPPMAVRSHSTRSMAASKALISGVALQEVCDAAGCSSPHTFVRFYSWTWTLPQVPKCSRPSAARKIHTGQALVAMVMLYWRSQSVFTQWSSFERERLVTTVTSVPWRGHIPAISPSCL